MNRTMRNPVVYALFVVPVLAVFAVFFLYPLFNAVKYGFTDWNGAEAHFNGLANFRKAFRDAALWKAFVNNLYFIAFSLFVQIPVIVALALLINGVRRLRGFYKTAIFVPAVLSTAVVGVLWKFILNYDAGLVNGLLRAVGLSAWAPYWLSSPGLAMLSILLVNAWQYVGLNVIIVLAAILGIPKEIPEAADIDGASGWRKAVSITIPLIRPVLFVIVLLSITGAMKALDIVFVMTGGGPYNSTQVLATYMAKQSFRMSHYGYGNTIAVMIFLLTMVLTLLFNWFNQRYGERDA